jgi:hypothetical protein
MSCKKPRKSINMSKTKTSHAEKKLEKNQWKSKPKFIKRIAKNVKNAKKAKKIV